MTLTWRRAPPSTVPEDGSCLHDGRVIGRVYRMHWTPPSGLPYTWAMNDPDIACPGITRSGQAATKEEAKRLVEEAYWRAKGM